MKAKILLSAIILVVTCSSIFGQTIPDYKKLHYLSKEEMNIPLTKSRNFYATDPPEGDIRNVAEYDEMQGVLISYASGYGGFGIPFTLIEEMAEDINVLTIVGSASEQQTVTTLYQNNGVNLDNCDFLITQIDSYWTRDFGPWYIFDGNDQPGIVNFKYNRPRPNDDNIPIEMSEYLDIDLYGMDLFTAGGNYMTTGMGIAASTDLIWEENTSYTTTEIADFINDYLGNSNYEVTIDPLGEAIKHIDCWGKYLSPGKILVGQVPETDSRYDDFEYIANYFSTTLSSYGKPYEVYRVYTPGTYPYTPYTNSLILNNKVFVPLTGSQWDDEAIESYEQAMPGYEIIGIDYTGWLNTDALHCRTKGIADIGMLYIDHMPTLGTVAYHPEYEITANITAHSGSNINTVLVYFKINSGDFTYTGMELESGNKYTGAISGVMPNDTVSYYIYAADQSGRTAKQPYIGENDPFVFKNIYFPTDEIKFNPDSVLFLSTDQMLNGIPLNIINLTADNVTINSITEEGTSFPWYVEQIPDFPYILDGNDTLTIKVFCPIATNKGALLTDEMTVMTNLDSYTEIIAVDSDLLTVVDANANEMINVYPNPFSSQITFAINNAITDNITIQIFDINGKVIYNNESAFNESLNHITINTNDQDINIGSGIYFYKITSENFSKTGKIIRAE
jgi:agmatine deiminase